ncbi:spore coat protein [Niallia endozanthoxylica]|uniref:Spore coat protein n=1 Tax=Niallia endozanthoxylica TaxID=2036016 RepID=A0A5J5H810_9BACI|nr:spore coat protein [Niallia endozanthoxylica]KAA9015742.1 spore coat protein [Niallia endozanthoxylica]
MNQMIQNMTGMGGMTDQVIATDFLIAAKTGVKNLALAITETSTPEVRDTLKQYLNDAIDTHEQIFKYMVDKGYYHPNNLGEQLSVDLQASQTALNLAQGNAQS